MEEVTWSTDDRRAWIEVRDHPNIAAAVAAVCRAVEADKFPPFPWRNITNCHTTNRSRRMGGGIKSLASSTTMSFQGGGWMATVDLEHAIYHNDGVPIRVTSSWPLAAVKDAQALAFKLLTGRLLVMAVNRIVLPSRAFQRGDAAVNDIYTYAGLWHSFLLGTGPLPPPYVPASVPGQPPPPPPTQPNHAAAQAAFGAIPGIHHQLQPPPLPQPQRAATAASPPPAPPPQPQAQPQPSAATAIFGAQPQPSAATRRRTPPPPPPPPRPSRAPPAVNCEMCQLPLASHAGWSDGAVLLPLPSCRLCGSSPSYHAPSCCPWLPKQPAQAAQPQEAAIGAGQQRQQQQLMLQQQALHQQQQQYAQSQALQELQQQQLQQQVQQHQQWQQVQQQLQHLQQQQLHLGAVHKKIHNKIIRDSYDEPRRVFQDVGDQPMWVQPQPQQPEQQPQPQQQAHVDLAPTRPNSPLPTLAVLPTESVLGGNIDMPMAAAAIGAQMLPTSTTSMPQLPLESHLGVHDDAAAPPATAPMILFPDLVQATADFGAIPAAPAATEAQATPKLAAVSTSPPMTELVGAAFGAEAEAAVAAHAAEDYASAVSETVGTLDAVSEAVTTGLDDLFLVVGPVQEELVMFGEFQEGGFTSSDAQPAHPPAHPWPAPYTPRSPPQ